MSGSDQSVIHVALVGITGGGKSTLVNVLKGEKAAKVDNDVRPCTIRATQYEVLEGDTRYCIWDTRGFNEASEHGAKARFLKSFGVAPDAEREAKKLLQDPKVGLVLFCIDAKKIRAKEHWKMYNKINTDFCERKLKVAVVVTQVGKTNLEGSELRRVYETCKNTAKGEVDEFPEAGLIEAMPTFEKLDDPIVEECKSRILGLIYNACRT